jgi:thiol-disulfide isomerase/thioredoxin
MVKRLSLVLGAVALCAVAGVGAWYILGSATGPSGAGGPAGPPITGAMAQFTLQSPPRPAPVAEFQDADGNSVTLLDFGDKVVLLNIWATWCVPCVEEMPALDRLQAELGDEGLAVVAVSVDLQGAKAVRPFYEKLGIKNLSIYLDPKSEFSNLLGADAVPSTLLFSRKGLFVGKLIGNAAWDSPEAIALLHYYLTEP